MIAVAASLTVGIMLGVVLSSNLLVPRSLPSSSGNTKNQGLVIGGTETIKVLAPDGSVVSTWQGPDPLSTYAINGIVNCIPGTNGGSTTPLEFGSCSSWITGIEIFTDSPAGICNEASSFSGPGNSLGPQCSTDAAAATNTLTPINCLSPSSVSCTGWITEATFGPSTFTQTNCGNSCAVEFVMAGPLGTGRSQLGGGVSFDYICAANYIAGGSGYSCLSGAIATVLPQDSLLVTIQFTVS